MRSVFRALVALAAAPAVYIITTNLADSLISGTSATEVIFTAVLPIVAAVGTLILGLGIKFGGKKQ